jgi:hypothetical protein
MQHVKTYTDRELLELIDRSIKATGRDVREGRIPLDGRARLPLPEEAAATAKHKPVIPDAAE